MKTGPSVLICVLGLSGLTWGCGVRQETPAVRNVILLIGDGMGPQQMSLLEGWATQATTSTYGEEATGIRKLANDERSVIGLSETWPDEYLVVDSACSASQLATGVASGSEMIGLDAQGDPVETILEKAKAMGKATGLVSDTRLTHATPAAFAAHVAHRTLEDEIARQMLEEVGVDVMLSGGLRHWIPQAVADESSAARQAFDSLTAGAGLAATSYRSPGDPWNGLEVARELGYELAFDAAGLRATQGDKVLGLFASSGMKNAIAYYSTEHEEPGLLDMAQKALAVLSRNEKGFFLMIEGGQIDWAGHSNDAGWMLHEMIKFDQVVDYIYEWAKDRDDTLVVLTADHETGSFGFSYTRRDLPPQRPLPGQAFTGRGYEYDLQYNFGHRKLLDELYEQKKTFGELLAELEDDSFGLRKNLDTPPPAEVLEAKAGELRELVVEATGYSLTRQEALAVLSLEPNAHQVPDHRYLKYPYFPKVDDFEPYYVYAADIHQDLLGRQLARQQNLVWGTGTHTSTPVVVLALGPEAVRRRFARFQHHTAVGQAMIAALEGR